ncbi:hypothetical protein M5689_007679 [Euphorbia peplus]|nr:hypothetical protein M5689_007679 [Euphorbia peplus]
MAFLHHRKWFVWIYCHMVDGMPTRTSPPGSVIDEITSSGTHIVALSLCTASCLKDSFSDAAVYGSSRTLWKKRIPLSNGILRNWFVAFFQS